MGPVTVDAYGTAFIAHSAYVLFTLLPGTCTQARKGNAEQTRHNRCGLRQVKLMALLESPHSVDVLFTLIPGTWSELRCAG